jgi:transposase
MSRTRRLFPESFKREAVDRVVSSGLSPGKVATEPGLHETVLRRWVKEAGVANIDTTTGLSPRPAARALPPMPSDLAAENARLRREVERLRMEREILKKTVTIFGAGQK